MPNQDFYERFNNNGSAGDPSTQKRSAFFDRFNAQSNPRYSDELAKRDEEERKRKEQEAIAQFQAKEQEAKNQQQSQSDFLASVGAITPDEQGGQTTFNASRLKNLANAAFDSTMSYSRVVADYAKDNGIGGVIEQTGLGAAKKVGEIASGIAKTGYGLSSSGYSTLRKIVSKVGGEEVAQYIDRNTPEYLKAVDAHIDEDGILNYKAKYDNQIQSVGGAAAEIGSYFIPVTRLSKVATLEKALADIPKVAMALEATPKVVKVGGKLTYEVSKDIVDASLLDAIQGKSWEDIQETAKMAGIGGGALRVGGKLLGSALKSFKENRILDTVTKAIPEITKEEKALANELLSQGKPLDDVVTDILAKREDDGVDIFKGIDDAVDEVPVKTPENTPETPSKMPQDVPIEVKAPDVPPVAAKAEDPLLQEAGIPKTAKVWIKSKFSNDGAYADIPVIRKEDGITLYQGGATGDKRQFWTPDKKYAEQFGNVRKKTGSFYRVNNGNTMTDVYVEAPAKSSNPLLQEARKYKSAEEFVKAQGDTLYHGSPDGIINKIDPTKLKPNGELGSGFYLSENPKMAGNYTKGTGEINEINIGGLKILNTSKSGLDGFVDNAIKYGSKEKYIQSLKDAGYDGIRAMDKGETVIFPESVSKLKTKSQLTDLYNQANKVDRAAAKPEQAIPIVKETPQNLNKAPEVAPKVAPEVPKEGAVKANSDFAKRLNQILPEGDKIDETYDTVNMRKEIAAAEKNAAEDPEKLDRLAMGTEKSSTETQTAANIVAVEKAVEKGDYEKAATLLNARFKANNRRGQEISMEQVSAAMNPHERPMKDVMKQRLERLTNKEKDPVKAQEIVDKKVEATKQEIRKAVKPKIKIERAQKLLDDLICPV